MAEDGWHTASPNGDTCVEVNEYLAPGVAGIRDTKQAGMPVTTRATLRVPHGAYAAFIDALRAGEFAQ